MQSVGHHFRRASHASLGLHPASLVSNSPALNLERQVRTSENRFGFIEECGLTIRADSDNEIHLIVRGTSLVFHVKMTEQKASARRSICFSQFVGIFKLFSEFLHLFVRSRSVGVLTCDQYKVHIASCRSNCLDSGPRGWQK